MAEPSLDPAQRSARRRANAIMLSVALLVLLAASAAFLWPMLVTD